MMLNRTMKTVLTAGLCLTTAAFGGPLTPPAGPVTSSYKTLNEVEPRIAINATNTPGDFEALFVITSPGSYYLTGNITGASGKKGIKIAANNVTLDLSGFAMLGGGVADDAIFATFVTNTTIRNGNIQNWVKEGIDGYNGANCRVDGILVDSSINGYGIITGKGSVITGCTVRNSGAGIVTTEGSTVRDCTASGNGTGFAIGWGNTVSGCTAQDSTAGPGFQTAPGCTLVQCAALSNHSAAGFGFDLGGGNTVTACSANNNDQDGFHVQTGTSNVLISTCTAQANKGNGIKTENGIGFTITGNNCSRNNVNGIWVSGGSTVTNNTCENNGTLVGAATSGIYVSFSYNRIDGNHVLASTYGIAVAAGMTNNLVVRNTATLCTTHYSFPAGVTYGAINALATGSFAETNSMANLRF